MWVNLDCYTVPAWWPSDCQWGMRHGLRLASVAGSVMADLNIDWETPQLHWILGYLQCVMVSHDQWDQYRQLLGLCNARGLGNSPGWAGCDGNLPSSLAHPGILTEFWRSTKIDACHLHKNLPTCLYWYFGLLHHLLVCVFSCDQAALWMVQSVCPSVRPSVCLSVTPFWLCSHHRIITEFSGVITNDRSDVHAKGHGQRSRSQRS